MQSHTEFHADLFPDTASGEAAMTTSQWKEGANTPVRAHTLPNMHLPYNCDSKSIANLG